MNRALTVAVGLTLLLTSGCADDSSPDPTPSLSTPSIAISVASPSPSPAPSITITEFPLPPEPSQQIREMYLRELDMINPDIVHGDPATAVERGRHQCAANAQFPDDRDRRIAMTNERFTSPANPDGFGTPVAARILDAVTYWLCQRR